MNVFASNPLRVDIANVSYVLVGNVPNDVKKALRKNPSPGDKRILKKFYGPQWAKKLGLSQCGLKHGGEDEIDADTAEIEAFLKEEEAETIVDGVIDDVFQADESKGTCEGVQFVHFPEVYPQDKISEFKQKLSLITGVPIYRQHIWFNSGGRAHPMAYRTYVDGIQIVNASISDISEDEKIDNIPVAYYDRNRQMSVRGYDTFSTLGVFYHRGVLSYSMVDLKDFVDPKVPAHAALARDKNKMDIVYYGLVLPYWPMLTPHAFQEYLKGESNIASHYPELAPLPSNLIKKFTLEQQIVGMQHEIFNSPTDLSAIQKRLSSSITYSVVSMMRNTITTTAVHMRNLFDTIELTPTIPLCRCVLPFNNKTFVLEKSHRNIKTFADKVRPNVMLIKIYPVPGYLQYINLFLNKNGNYVIKAHWREENEYSFGDVFDTISIYVNRVLSMINKMGTQVVRKKLLLITANNIKFTEINVSIFYKKSITESQFDILKQQIHDHSTAGLVIPDIDDDSVKVFFSKGMYQHDPTLIEKLTDISNHYSHMSDGVTKQKWFLLFEKTHATTFSHRFSDVKIDIIGIKEDEFPIFYRSVVGMIHTLEKSTKGTAQVARITKKKLKTLKEQDPVLYDSRRLYKSNVVYSKICQKPYQPLLLKEEKYRQLNPEKKARTIKYWNFTSNQDAYYLCPNPKYPYIKFFVNKHPKGYCIPCCKKIQISDNPKDPKRIMHDICMNTHKYTKQKKLLTVGSKYIMSYGKNIEKGRISRLPETTLEPLLYETYSAEHQGIDKECESVDGYYLYGVAQNTPQFTNIGFLFCLADALGVSIENVVTTFISGLSQTDRFHSFLGGKISSHLDQPGLIGALTAMKSSKPGLHSEEIPWNSILMELAHHFYEINTILFSHEGADFLLELPPKLMDSAKFINPNRKNLVVLRKHKTFYPIYMLNTDVFFRAGIIDKKTYPFGSHVMLIIENVVRKFLIAEKRPVGVMHQHFDLFTIEQWQTEVNFNKSNITRMYVDSTNFCYGVDIGDIYIPVQSSHWSEGNIEYNPFVRKNAPTFKHLNSVVTSYNNWVKKSGDVPIFPLIIVHEWVALKGKVIGFLFRRMTFYFRPISFQQARKMKAAHVRTLLYDPDIVNAAVHLANPSRTPTPDPRTKNISANYYQFYLYQLFLTEFMLIFTKSRNRTVRTNLKKILAKNFTKNMATTDSFLASLPPEDESIIRHAMSNYMTHRKKKVLLEEIDSTRFKFDDVTRERIESATHMNAKKEIRLTAKRFVTFGKSGKIVKNMYGDKLIMEKSQFEEFVDIFASDIKDPLKRDLIFSSILIDPAIKYFRFIKRDNEVITVGLASDKRIIKS